MTTEKKTPVFEEHTRLGGRMVPFAGYLMPVQYQSIVAEHQAVREQVGLFDVSHMGELWIRGKEAASFLDFILPAAITKLFDGRICYTPILNEKGNVLDDLLVYRVQEDTFLLVVNASNTNKIEQWLISQKTGKFASVTLDNETSDWGLLALQGPESQAVLQAQGWDLKDLPYYHFQWESFEGQRILISRTGYTGEEGFELMVPWANTESLWKQLLQAENYSITPAGLGCRDTLRIEVCFPLYGHELDEAHSPLESGIGWTMDRTKDQFVGKEALLMRDSKETLIGFEMIGKGIPRQGYPVEYQGTTIGQVTSGSYLPSVKKNMGLAFVKAPAPKPGTPLALKIRNQSVEARVVAKPFYTPMHRRKQ